MSDQPVLNIPVVLGTVRQERRSERVALWLVGLLTETPQVDTALLDVRNLSLPWDDAGRQAADPGFAAAIAACDGMVLVVPEYNGGFPGLLKHALDTLLEEYQRKAVGIVSVSVGGLGGVRMIPTLLPVLRDVGLIASRRDLSVSRVEQALDPDGTVLDAALPRRAHSFLEEMLWMTRALKTARETSPS